VLLIASLIAIDIAIVGSWFGVEKTAQRIEQTTVRDVEVREDPTVYALEMARDYPLFGTGAGTFATAFMRYRGPDILDFYDHAHNDYTQFLVETGALGSAPVALRCGAGLLAFGLAYGAATAGLRHPEARRLLGALRRRTAAPDA